MWINASIVNFFIGMSWKFAVNTIAEIACIYLDFPKESSPLFNKGMSSMGLLVKKRVFILVIFSQKILERLSVTLTANVCKLRVSSWDFLKMEKMQIKWWQLKAILMDKTDLKQTIFCRFN